MNMRTPKLLLTLSISAMVLTAYAGNSNQSSWQSANEEYQKQFGDEQYDEAEKTATEALEKAKKGYGDKSFVVAVCLNNLSRVHQKLGQTKESKQYFSAALKMTEDLIGTRDPKVAKALKGATQGNPNAGDPFADFNLNTLPWIKWGNSPMDRTSPNERLEKFYGAFLPAYLEQSKK